MNTVPLRSARRDEKQVLSDYYPAGGSDGSPIIQSLTDIVLPLPIEKLSSVPQAVTVWLGEGQDAISRCFVRVQFVGCADWIQHLDNAPGGVMCRSTRLEEAKVHLHALLVLRT